jgi:glycine cleavage system H protein
MYPSNYKYTINHQWLDVQGDIAVVGLTNFVQQEMGEVVYVELPEVGKSFEKGDEMGSVEFENGIEDIYTPLSGTVTEVNDSLQKEPSLLSDDPHHEGWLVKIRYTNASELNKLMHHEDYESFLRQLV